MVCFNMSRYEINGNSTYRWPRWKILCHNDVNYLGRVICLDTCVDSNAQAFFNMTEYYINIAFFCHLFSEKMESLMVTCDRSILSLAYKKR